MGLGFGPALHPEVHVGQGINQGDDLRAVRSGGGFAQLQGAQQQRLGLRILRLVAIQVGERFQGGQNLNVARGHGVPQLHRARELFQRFFLAAELEFQGGGGGEIAGEIFGARPGRRFPHGDGFLDGFQRRFRVPLDALDARHLGQEAGGLLALRPVYRGADLDGARQRLRGLAVASLRALDGHQQPQRFQGPGFIAGKGSGRLHGRGSRFRGLGIIQPRVGRARGSKIAAPVPGARLLGPKRGGQRQQQQPPYGHGTSHDL